MTIEISTQVAGAVIAFGGVVLGLLVNGDRGERRRRRELHARALAALLAYAEMPFAIRRRRCEGEHASAERVRLSEHFSDVKAEIATCQVLLAADGDERLSAAYNDLVETARATAGAESHEAWKEAAVATDSEMNMPALHGRLQPFRDRLREFELTLASATLPRRKRLWRWWCGTDIKSRQRRVVEQPHDRPGEG
jgi:hypothetical protein